MATQEINTPNTWVGGPTPHPPPDYTENPEHRSQQGRLCNRETEQKMTGAMIRPPQERHCHSPLLFSAASHIHTHTP